MELSSLEIKKIRDKVPSLKKSLYLGIIIAIIYLFTVDKEKVLRSFRQKKAN